MTLMTQIVVTLEKNADENFLRRMIENMKGVLKTSLTHHKEESKAVESLSEESDWLQSLHAIKDSIDPNIIDNSDPRTSYIMSK